MLSGDSAKPLGTKCQVDFKKKKKMVGEIERMESKKVLCKGLENREQTFAED